MRNSELLKTSFLKFMVRDSYLLKSLFSAPSDEGAVERSETEGEKKLQTYAF